MSNLEEHGVKRVDETPIIKNKESLGICSVCKNWSTCIYAKNPKWPVVQCEQFVAYNTFPEKLEDKRVSTSQDPMVTFNPKRFQKMQRIV